jgi:hypothetical protein
VTDLDRPSAIRQVKDASAFAGSLLELGRVDGDERRLLFRQAFAALAGDWGDGPGPLEGIHPGALGRGVQTALEAGLLDDLDWLEPPAAGRALFGLASALPSGPVQREIGRRALSRLLEGNAETFGAMATVMAKTGSKALASAPVVARASLLFELPIQAGVAEGPFAHALASRKLLAQTWVVGPSSRSLSSRRLSARILERAAREVATRAQRKDPAGLRLFADGTTLGDVVRRLLDDREPLVWRHAAVTRGLLAGFRDDLLEELEEGLAPTMTPTEWRRCATAIAAHAAVRPEAALRLAATLFRGEVAHKDPGVAGPFVWGLARAAETEPEAAAELFAHALGGPPEEVAEAVIYLRRELGPCAFLEDVERRMLDRCMSAPVSRKDDDGAVALKGELLKDLEGRPREAASDDEPVRSQIEQALGLFTEMGARVAHGKGLEVLASAHSVVDTLVAMSQGGESAMSRRASLAVLRDLDLSLLERDVLGDLLRLDTNVERARIHDDALGALRGRTARWILDRETGSDDGAAHAAEPPHLVLRLSRLRALLHLCDSDAVGAMREGSSEDASKAAERDRWQTIVQALLTRVESRPSKALRRALLATLARSLDGLVRTMACDVVDALLVVSAKMSDPRDFETLAEASMDADLRHVLRAYASFLRAGSAPAPVEPAAGDSMFPEGGLDDARLAALDELADAMITVGSWRSDAFRSVLSRLSACLSTLARAPSLRALADTGGRPDIVASFEASAHALQQLATGARSRVLELTEASGARAGASRALSTAVARVLSGSDEELDRESLELSAQSITSGIPRAIGGVVEAIIRHVGGLPHDGSTLPEEPALAEQLPPWLPARRVLGAFYVLRPLSAGGAGSVFVVCRTEDRREKNAERFALKVPDYSANAARHLSETQFFHLFRSEASALMALPHHPNLARFVTFDLAARPRPILVMELVEGSSLERLIEARTLDVGRAFDALDQVLAGLEVMHGVGVGHLDLKPANVVLRVQAAPSMRSIAGATITRPDTTGPETAVLVDFGLAGRNIRPGCASGPYGAPEVWGALPEGSTATPMAADVYAFGCLAFEVLTGDVLFDAESEVALIASHIAHDGLPPKLRSFTKSQKLSSLAETLFGALRRDPSARLGVAQLRHDLRQLRKKLEGASWPLRP